jgi:chemotaxis regulatin CheY-phosphate phosphatase CheZ
VVKRDLEIAEERLDYYSQMINDKSRSSKITVEQARKYFKKLDQWFETLDRHWDTLNSHY